MNRADLIDSVLEEAVTVTAIGAIAFLATVNVADPSLYVGAVAGLGGYRLLRDRNGRPTDDDSDDSE